MSVSSTADLRRRLSLLLAEHGHAVSQAERERQAIQEAEDDLADLTDARGLVQQVAASVQASAHRQIASVVSRCLEAVFGEDAYRFRIDFDRKRGKTEARLLFERDGLVVSPTEAAGGGAVDVAAFALRLACLVLRRPRRRRLLVLDEPWKMLSREYRPAVRDLVQTLAREFGVQFVLVTHAPELAIGKVVELG